MMILAGKVFYREDPIGFSARLIIIGAASSINLALNLPGTLGVYQDILASRFYVQEIAENRIKMEKGPMAKSGA